MCRDAIAWACAREPAPSPAKLAGVRLDVTPVRVTLPPYGPWNE